MSIFSKVQLKKPKYNKFDLGHERKMSCFLGDLVPVMVQDVIPGDKFQVNTEMMARLAPMIAPIMHRMNATMHFFFVPNRLVWDEWEDFITGGKDGTAAPVWPHFTKKNGEHAYLHDLMGDGSLADYLGLPDFSGEPDVAEPNVQVSALPFRAYQLIYNEYYRDQNLENDLDISKASGDITTPAELLKLLVIRKRAWEKDYFTSALPFSQRGPDVLIPIEGDVDFTYKSPTPFNSSGGGGIPSAGSAKFDGSSRFLKDQTNNNMTVDNIQDISFENTTVTINELRKAFRLQEFFERLARGGARYVEVILSFFGVKSSDARLQRPEYLGGGMANVVISEVLSTVQFDGGTPLPQGNMSGHGIAIGNTNRFRYTAEEHGYIIGLVSFLPRTGYQDGVPRHFMKSDRLDYFWPQFAHLGEQEIKNMELYCRPGQPAQPDPQGTFGYTPRYAEYKFTRSSTHGEFKNSLSYWHMNRIFTTAPALNEDFVHSDPTNRIFAVEDDTAHKVYMQLYNNVSALRMMPYFGTPTL